VNVVSLKEMIYLLELVEGDRSV